MENWELMRFYKLELVFQFIVNILWVMLLNLDYRLFYDLISFIFSFNCFALLCLH